MDLKTYTGTIEWFKTGKGETLVITAPHKPDEASVSLPIVGVFEEYLNKKVKIMLEVIEE